MTNSTAFPLGIYVGNPNGNSASANAAFEANFNAFVTTMGGATPGFMDAFTDFSVDPSQWAANANWTAWSWAQTGDAYVGPGSGIIPVIGVPLASNAGGWSHVDTFYKAIIAGTYDSVYKGIVDAWANQGYKTMQMRIAYEFDGNFMPWGPGNSSAASANADFIAAWQHVADLVHAQGAAKGVTVQTVWNPADISWASTPPAKLYPGDQYVDIISSDAYSPTYPNDLTNWSTGGTSQMSSLAAWAAIAANRAHFWQYTDGTKSAPTGNGQGWSMDDLITFAAAHGKPISISETGAGGNGTTTGPVDDAAFPQWLAGALAQAQAAGVKVLNVNIWATDQSDGKWGFLKGQKPAEAAAWARYFGAGSGPDAVSNVIVSSGVTSTGVTVASGGIALVLPGGSAVSTTVQGGGKLVVIPGGTASATTTQPGGAVVSTGVVIYTPPSGVTLAGATVNGPGVGSGGSAFVLSGGTATAITVSNGGQEVVCAGGVASATVVSSGGGERISSGGTTLGTLVSGGGTERVFAGGTASATAVSSGGTQLVSSGGAALGTMISNGGLARVYTGGTTIGVTVTSGGYEYISSGGVASATVVSSGGGDNIYAGGVARGTTVLNGGFERVYSGGVASGSQVSSNGTLYASAGGMAIAAVLSSGSAERVSSGGVASATTVLSGGRLVVSAGGLATNAVISNGGTEAVSAGGLDAQAVISSGGMAFIYSGGTISGGTLISGGRLTVSAGGVVTGGLTLSGGMAIISGSVASGQTVSYAAPSGNLVLYNLSAFSAVIGGFTTRETIDLANFAYSGATRTFTEAAGNASGTLSVSNGGSQASLTLLGSYATSNFALSSDGAGGTYVKFTS